MLFNLNFMEILIKPKKLFLLIIVSILFLWFMKIHTILAYAAQENAAQMDLKFATDIGTLVVLAVTAVILWYTARETKRSGLALKEASGAAERTVRALKEANRYEKEKNKREALIEVFKLLNDNAHRNARRRVHRLRNAGSTKEKKEILYDMNACRKDDLDPKIDAIHTESKEIVKADFEQMGALVKQQLVPQADFIEIYWHTIILSWDDLSGEISKMKDANPAYMANFQNLKQADEYREKNYKNLKDDDLNKFDIS
jgi:hypothetical protein